MEGQHAYRTGEVAKLLHVSVKTVSAWIERRDLKAERLPGSRHWRIGRDELIAFVRRHGLPVPAELAEAAGQETVAVLKRQLRERDAVIRNLQDQLKGCT